jgi:hypothetical protein
MAKRYRENKRKHKAFYLKADFGLTIEEYEKMVKDQEGLCAICRRPQTKALAVDHDHRTKKIRGLLCDRCNLGLGQFQDQPERLRQAAHYIERTT